MRPFPLRNLLILCSLLIYLTAGSPSARATILCLGQDGHVGYTVSAEACCTLAAESAVPLCERSLGPRGSCGPCLDIPFTTVARHQKGSRAKDSAARAVPAGPVHRPVWPKAADAAGHRLPALSAGGFSANAPLTHLATVVLLN